ncbi:MAG: 16S rRNA (cytidine(1402)-2'-O)-methyltransferase [Xanthomonadales bacterium]|nr:16S rRNA (cytidine(1402)-2'-O)-methyltransferase [Xanthomonadales bacterium]MCE7931829.1 16S rRNA (cytidine(1402)-2'-O)-methyltransferase [Xanthomonadales bacterium PRO6]
MRIATSPATLYVVATPIGNLEDFSPRARQVLSEVDAILCEDTRQSAVLLRHAGIARPLLALHEHNEEARAATLVERLRAGQSLALVSDAGTPLISDPGYRLVSAVRAAGFAVSTIPGPCALIAALSVAGLATDRFVFEGFLPAKSGERRARLQALAADTRTLVCYEAPHRIVETLVDAVAELGGARRAVLARELSKRFETVLDGTLAELLERVRADPDQQRGEIVLVLAGADAADAAARTVEGRRLYALLADELPPARAAKVAAAYTGARKRDLYRGAE